QDLREREQMLASGETTSETAEKSYRIRVAIRALKEEAARMKEIVDKESRKKKIKDPERLAERKEILELCQKHIEELENLEKRRFNDGYTENRVELLSGGRARTAVGRSAGGGGGPSSGEADPFTSELPDIEVEEDLKAIQERDKAINQDLEDIGVGVAKLKEMAQNMGQELDKQTEMLDNIERGVDTALDHVDNLNVKLKKTLDGMMKGDRFMVNCILLCVLLALVAFVASQFT
ncbi:hypothetical protein BDK51DRAFT_18899, partial [Blyttiomyces helicus]